MQVEPQYLSGVLRLIPKVHYDHRGYFWECYHQKKFHEMGINIHFVQSNQSLSQKGTLRGLHYQLPPYAQAKLIHVVYGTIWDVIVDLRPKSPTFGLWQGFILSSENKHQLFIPKGFAHGFITLSHEAILSYQCDEFYNPKAEQGILFKDPTLNIPWEHYEKPQFISSKDKQLPLFKALKFEF